ncbi:MAG: ion transporter [Planctomycetota bacterium]
MPDPTPEQPPEQPPESPPESAPESPAGPAPEPAPDAAPSARPIPARRNRARWRRQLESVIFGTQTRAGRSFDLMLLVVILASVVAVSLETVPSFQERYGGALRAVEWGFTAIFTLEYVARLLCAPRPARYARSFFGVVDLLAILPSFIGLLFPGAHELAVVRGLRLLRIFRILKLGRYAVEATSLRKALVRSRAKIAVFLLTVVCSVAVVGAAMHLIEGEDNGFTSIPVGMYWAIVTMSTVGYGDISPQTPLGQAVASLLILFGYALIVVPTGVISAELAAERMREYRQNASPTDEDAKRRNPGDHPTLVCQNCGARNHADAARYCHRCGAAL